MSRNTAHDEIQASMTERTETRRRQRQAKRVYGWHQLPEIPIATTGPTWQTCHRCHQPFRTTANYDLCYLCWDLQNPTPAA